MPSILRIPFKGEISRRSSIHPSRRRIAHPTLLSDDEMKERDATVFEELTVLRKRFTRMGRKSVVFCRQLGEEMLLESCLANCSMQCRDFDVMSIIGENDSPHELLTDVVKYQRAVNILQNGWVFGRRRDVEEDGADK